jgi:hypothetical protein
MHSRFGLVLVIVFILSTLAFAQRSAKWGIHDMNRPKPQIVDPGTASTQDKTGTPPSDAIVLFDGMDLSAWCTMDGSDPKWKVENGYMETVGGSGALRTWQAFGDCQLHVEWSAPTPAKGDGQGRGNSGVFLMEKYEIQVLDSYENITYADGQASSIYGQYPPMVNANKKPGEWQTYDIIFSRPRFDKEGKLKRAAFVTVLQNGVLTQNHTKILGPTNWQTVGVYEKHPKKLFLSLQDHSNPVRYRNIWIRELPEAGQFVENRKIIALPTSSMEKYAGDYQKGRNSYMKVRVKHGQLYFQPNNNTWYPLNAHSLTEFSTEMLAAKVVFEMDKDGNVVGLTEYMGGGKSVGKK